MAGLVRRDRVVRLDPDGEHPVGVVPKMAAHRRGLLHAAVSVLVVNRGGRMLLQRRAAEKYHSAGQWSNACCTHPMPGEEPLRAARRRLAEEMGIRPRLVPLGTIRYAAPVGRGLREHEHVHLFGGIHGGAVRPDPAECSAFAWVAEDTLRRACRTRADAFTPWFRLYLDALGDGIAHRIIGQAAGGAPCV
ncbi:MAG TPA: isopentenyl-diphosphate Delta-isomerase [Azospirillum sp.]|nr:isopentenyl-diphosphate Delta-isomerase [Azospirillum sp.]